MSAVVRQALPADTPEMRVDLWLLGALAALLSLGVVMVYSASAATSAESGWSRADLRPHLMNVVAAVVALKLVYHVPLLWWKRASGPLLAVAGVLLVLVLIPGLGVEVNGSRRWLPLGPLRMQPSELAKLAVVLYAAAHLARHRDKLQEFRFGILFASAPLAGTGLLLLLEPDFGTTVVLTVTVAGMLFLAGVRLWHFSLCMAAGLASMVLLTVVAPYRMARVMSFLDPWSDPYDGGFQLIQALIAFGRGEWLGVGLGASVQKLFYLPHASTDFLLAVIGEELGLLGVTAVLVLFAVVLWRAFCIARQAERTGDVFAMRLAQGLGLLLVLQALINVGVNLGVLPTKGLTLPFLSYGGSSLVVSCAAVGLLLAIGAQTRPRPRARGDGA